MEHIPTIDIKLASILISLGIPMRQSDPVTCVVSEKDGRRHEQFTFWFSGERDETRKLIDAYYKAKDWKDLTLGPEHPMYYMKGALENREVLLHWIRTKVKPMKVIQEGEITILVGERASAETKEKIRKHL